MTGTQDVSAKSALARGLTFGRLLFICTIVGVMTSGLIVPVGGIALYFERAVNLFLLAYMLISFLSDRERYAGRSLLFVWLGWNAVLLLSAMLTDDPVAHLPSFVLSLLPAATFWLVARYRFEADFIARVVRITLWVTGVAGVGAIVLRYAGFELPIAFDYAGRLHLFAYEPNLFGSALGCLLFLALPRLKLNWSSVVLLVLVLISFAASASKMPFIAVAVGAPLYLILRAIARGRGGNTALVGSFWLGLVGIIGALSFAPSIQSIYETSLARADAVGVRLYLFQIAVERFEQKPVLGNGPGSFQFQSPDLLRQFGVDEANEQTIWIGNMFLAIAHDAGVVGLIPYLIFLIGVVALGLRSIRAGSVDHCGYLTAFLVIILSSQASTVHLNAIFGLSAGLVVLAPQRRAIPSPSGKR